VQSAKVHPRDVGFQLGLEAQFSEDWSEVNAVRHAEDVKDIVYVVIGGDGKYLKVGQSGSTLWSRWNPVLNLIAGRTNSPRPSEGKFRDRWRAELPGRKMEIWFKRAEKVTLTYLGETDQVSGRGSEEIYLDRYYDPVIGTKLDGRRSRKVVDEGIIQSLAEAEGT
jgi:hypothetical protein